MRFPPVLAAILALALGLAAPLAAQPVSDPAPLEFAGPAEEARFHALTAQLRCVQCQNQSLADSNAQIAQDMRREVLALMRQDRSDAQIKQFLVDRYGEFVLYRPAVQSHTWLLWFGPGLVLLLGAWVVYRVVRGRSAGIASAEAQEQDQEW
jgi:cytochrome c-type biogenesis protein CcmH